MKFRDRLDLSKMSLGMEIEAAGMNRLADLKDDGEFCKVEGSIHDRHLSIGNDPLGQYNIYGGEIKVAPAFSDNPEQELFDRVIRLLDVTQCPTINMPSTMHVHVQMKELLLDENLDILKHLVMYTQKWWPTLVPIISKLPDMDYINNRANYASDEQHKMFVRAYRDKYATRHSIHTDTEIARMMPQTTFNDFINAMTVHNGKGKPMWNIYRRHGVNFAKLRPTEEQTIEFRQFSATSDPIELRNIIEFPRLYIEAALEDVNPIEIFQYKKYPDFYNWINEDAEISHRWLKTDHDKLERKDIINNIKFMLINKEITLKDLGYPQFWINELGDQYEELLSYSKLNES